MANANAISGNYFDVLGAPPQAGRALGPADNQPDAAPAAMISDAFWRRRFGRAPDAVGRAIVINGIPFTIAGVTARGFRGTGQVGRRGGRVRAAGAARPRHPRRGPRRRSELLVGAGHGPAAARARRAIRSQGALDLALKRSVADGQAGRSRPRTCRGRSSLPGARGQQEERDRMRDPLRTMAIVVSIVLLVACANVANLLLARGRARVRELSVRAAIGAPRVRVIRQLFTEGALLAACGAALGVVAARWIIAALLPALTEQPGAAPAALDWRLLVFVSALAGGCAILFALAPAVRSTRTTLTSGLQAARRGTAGPRRGRLSGALVILQIALSMVLVVTAALLGRSLRNLDRAEIGFDPRGVLTFRLESDAERLRRRSRPHAV